MTPQIQKLHKHRFLEITRNFHLIKICEVYAIAFLAQNFVPDITGSSFLLSEWKKKTKKFSERFSPFSYSRNSFE